MNSLIPVFLTLWSVLFPVKTWFAPDQPINITIKPSAEITLTLTDFKGKALEANSDASVTAEKVVDIKALFPALAKPGTYILFAVPKGKPIAEFEGTPLVIEVREDGRRGAPPGPMVVRVVPLCYAVMTTNRGEMTMVFYFDVAPNTAENFLSLASQGYFDCLSFHRIIPEFVIQGGDPRGDGTGGPGYNITAEFNDRPHEPGVLSMARGQEPDSAGSQFFICLDYKTTKQLDGKYTAFGKVTAGMDTVKAIAATPTGENDKPRQPQTIQKVEVKAVTKTNNPYATQLQMPTPAAAK